MVCLICKDLDRVLESTLASYMAACRSPFYRVSTDLAGKKEVDMERAKSALQEHQFMCPFAVKAEAGESARAITTAGSAPLPGPKEK